MQNRIASSIGFALLCMVLSSTAHALSFRAYLSVSGSDSNPCTVQLPCRLLPAALDAIVNGGEVWMLDSANYNTGPVNITKSVSILAIPGAVGSVVAVTGPAINIATASVNVSLRNLVIVPFPGAPPNSGIVMTNGDSLTISDTLVANLGLHGITVNANQGTRLKIIDSVIRNNGFNGVTLEGGAIGDIANSKVIGNFNAGVGMLGTPSTTTTVAVNDSLLSENFYGLFGNANGAGSTVRWTAIRTTSSHNAYAGFYCQATAGTTALCTVGYSMATGNSSYGFSNTGATFRSMGNNIVIDNTTNISGTITPLAGS
jgi:hypothetical protein